MQFEMIIIRDKTYVIITRQKVAVSTVAKGSYTHIDNTFIEFRQKRKKGGQQQTAKKDCKYGPRSSVTVHRRIERTSRKLEYNLFSPTLIKKTNIIKNNEKKIQHKHTTSSRSVAAGQHEAPDHMSNDQEFVEDGCVRSSTLCRSGRIGGRIIAHHRTKRRRGRHTGRQHLAQLPDQPLPAIHRRPSVTTKRYDGGVEPYSLHVHNGHDLRRKYLILTQNGLTSYGVTCPQADNDNNNDK